MRQALAKQLLVSFDDNRDGVIQYEELKKHYNKMKDQARRIREAESLLGPARAPFLITHAPLEGVWKFDGIDNSMGGPSNGGDWKGKTWDNVAGWLLIAPQVRRRRGQPLEAACRRPDERDQQGA